MPDDGWPVSLVATPQCDKAEAIMVHELEEGKNGCLSTAEKYNVFKHPFKIPFSTCTSPIFILANMWEQRKTLTPAETQWREANWGADMLIQFEAGAALIDRYIERAQVPNSFKRRVGRDTRGSSRGDAVPGLPQDKYDYQCGKYGAEKKKTTAQTNSDTPDEDRDTASEEEGELGDNGPSGALLSPSSHSDISPLILCRRPRRGIGRRWRNLQLSRQSPLLSQRGPVSSENLDDDERGSAHQFDTEQSSSEAVDNGIGSSSFETPLESSELSSEYADDETDSERGTRDSPLRLRSHRSLW